MSTPKIIKNGLQWFLEEEFGFFDIQAPSPYNGKYFENYAERAKTPIGIALTKARLDLVTKHIGSQPLLDVGIGSGQFLFARKANTRGYDVNPKAIRLLLDEGMWQDPHFERPVNASCWDSLEHMRYPEHFLINVLSTLFVSIPIFSDLDHVLSSKHFKPDEHFWYFTKAGLLRWMDGQSFELLEENLMECTIGRENIGTFVFRRKR